MKDLRYPIGKYLPPKVITQEHIKLWSKQIKDLPNLINDTITGLSSEQIKNSYRRGGWNIHELIYHITDSHLNSYIRYKWALTEDSPVIKAYDEKAWAKTNDVYAIGLEDMVNELQTIQNRIARIVTSLSEENLSRTYIHPESNKSISLAIQTGMYAWHGQHHLEHIKIAIANPIRTYIPIDCGFYDELVLHAIRKNNLVINKGGQNLDNVTIVDLTTKAKEEFIHFDNGDIVRLDDIIEVDDGVIYLK
jgi:transcriptional antiterminator Rof (Rho-off)